MTKKLKLKTHRGAAKRFKRTKRGKFLRSKAFKQHILSSKTTSRKRKLRGTTTVADVDVRKLERMLPYKRKKLLGLAKGYYANKSKLYRAAKESVDTALKYAFVGRRRKKRDYRRLWVVRINAAAREHGITYGQLISGLKNAGVALDRKSLSELATSNPSAFAVLARQAKGAAISRG